MIEEKYLLCCPDCLSLPELVFEIIEGEACYTLGCSDANCPNYAYAFRLPVKEYPIENTVTNWNELNDGCA